MHCRGSQRMGADRLLLVLRALTLKGLVLSLFTVVDIVVDPLVVPDLVMTERQDARVRFGLLARGKRIIERNHAFGPHAFGLFARELCFDHPFMHHPQFLVLADRFPNGKDEPQDHQHQKYPNSNKNPHPQSIMAARGHHVDQEKDNDWDEQVREQGFP